MKQHSYLVSGSGSGIGKAIAQQISNNNPLHRIILMGRNREKLEATCQTLLNPEQHMILVADQSHQSNLQQAIRSFDLEKTNLTAVIANAGIGGENHYGDTDRWDDILNTNLSGTYVLIQECLAALRKSSAHYKHILTTSSILARIGVPQYSAYCASKAGVLGLTRSLAAELASEKILVNAVCPGWVDTEMSDEGLIDIAKKTGRTVQQERDAQMNYVPLRKMAEPAEIARLVAFLTSAEQTSITGQAIDINNGAWMG